jgi:hypothetical protein
MSSRSLSDTQTRAEGERLHVWYNTDGGRMLYSLSKRLDENIRIPQQFKIKWMIFGEKIKLKKLINNSGGKHKEKS